MIPSAEKTKKGSLIFIGLLFFLIWSGTAFSSDSLSAVPSSLNLTLAPGQLVSYRLEVINLENTPLEVKCVFDPQWMFIFPSEFMISPERVKIVWAIFFIRREESPPKEGKVEFTPANGGKPATVWVACLAPRSIMPPPVREKEDKPDELEKLRKEIKEGDQKVAELKKEMGINNPHPPAPEKPSPQKEAKPSPIPPRSAAKASPAGPEKISAQVAAKPEATGKEAVGPALKTFLVTKANVKMRAEPNSASRVILVLKSGREVEKIGESGEYTKVRLPWGDTGWVATRTLQVIKRPMGTEPEPAR
jgi:hypothetical protein